MKAIHFVQWQQFDGWNVVGVSIRYPCFPIGRSGNSNFVFGDKFLFSGSGLSARRPTPNLEDQGLLLVWPLPFDQSGMVRPARDQKSPPAQLSGSLRHTSSTTTTRCQPKVKKKIALCIVLSPPMLSAHDGPALLCFVAGWWHTFDISTPVMWQSFGYPCVLGNSIPESLVFSLVGLRKTLKTLNTTDSSGKHSGRGYPFKEKENKRNK